MSWLRVFIGVQRFKWKHKLHWWRSVPPHSEFKTFFVEGKKGEGKTRYLARWAVRMMRRGFRVCANFTIRDRLNGTTSSRVAGWMDVLRESVYALENGVSTVFVIDEFHLWCDSRAWQRTPAWFRGWLAQSRHYGVGLCGSVQNFKTVDVRARQIVDELRRIRKVHLGRVPIYRMEEVVPETVDDEKYGLEKPHLGFFRWWAGYDTRELIQVEEWESDDEIELEVKVLTDRAAELVAPGVIPAFVDEEW